ncbi:MAG: helix-turn-helix domain-containing protein [Acidobacteria bacterium]|nr:helix-turn-helix domain-containing protein [Acidobacteriota bacterium]
MFEHIEYLDAPAADGGGDGLSLAEGRQNKGTSGADNDQAAGRGSAGTAPPFQKLTAAERLALERWARQRSSPHRLVVRSRIVLLISDGLSAAVVAARLHVAPATVRLWTRRFAVGRLPALLREAPGRGRRSGIAEALTRAVLEATRRLADGPRTVRQVAALAGTSPSTVWRIWRRAGLTSRSPAEAVEAALAKVIAGTAERPDTGPKR